MEITKDLYSSMSSYFNTLSQLGYKDYKSVYKLLAYTFIEGLLTGPMRFYITESDYRKIGRALSCLYGSTCLIPYPQYVNEDTIFGKLEDLPFILPRITEIGSDIRITEDNEIRTKASSYNE